jgi:hypothetical protein
MTRKIELAPGVMVVAIGGEDDAICEQCGAKSELRPYGKRLESGRRLSICYDCAMKDEPMTAQAFKELFDE